MRSILLALVLATGDAPHDPGTTHDPGAPHLGTPHDLGIRSHPVDGPDVDVRVQIQDQAVRFQVVMNLAYVDEIVDTPREDEFGIQKSEHAGIRATLVEFLQKSNTVKIDGVKVEPLDQGFEVEEGDPDMLPLFPRSREKALVRVQMSLEYPCKSAPSRVSFAWGEFPVNPVLATPDTKPRIEIKAHLIARGIDQIVPLTIAEPEYTWHDTGESLEDRFLSVPEAPKTKPLRVSLVTLGLGILALLASLFVLLTGFSQSGRSQFVQRATRLSVLLVVLLPVAWFARNTVVTELPNPFDGTPALPTAVEAQAIFEPLHSNIYRAFDYVEESDIYDALARSVRGDLLDDLYNQVYRSLIMHEEGGAVSRVQSVRTKSAAIETVGTLPTHENRPGFQVLAKWQVDGVVRHWNHAHYRTNEYEARYTVVQADEGWRIAEHQVLGQKRIDEGDDVPNDLSPDRGKPDPSQKAK